MLLPGICTRYWSKQYDEVLDGGYGWVVVFASWIVHIIVLGLQYSFGIIYSALLKDEAFSGGSEGRSAASWVGSISVCLTLGFASFTGSLVQRFGERQVVIFGGILTLIGFISSSNVTDLRQLYGTYGVLIGIGFSCSFPPSVMIVNRYFKKKRSLATGIAVSGSGVGTFILGATTQALIEAFGWRKTMQILGIMAGCGITLAAFTYIPVIIKKKSLPSDTNLSEVTSTTNLTDMAHSTPHMSPSQSTPDVPSASSKHDQIGLVNAHHQDHLHDHMDHLHHIVPVQDDHHLPPHHTQSMILPDSHNIHNQSTHNLPHTKTTYDLKTGKSFSSLPTETPIATPAVNNTLPLSPIISEEMITPKDITIHSDDHSTSPASTESHNESSSTTTDPNVIRRQESKVYPKLTMLQTWRQPAFIPMAIVLFIYGGCLFVPYGHIVVYATDVGLSTGNAARLVSYLGISGTIGRIVFGEIADLPCFTRVFLMQFSLMVAGAATLGLAFVNNEAGLITIAVIFGFFSGSVVSMVPPIMVDALGIENLPHSQGGAYTSQALTVLCGPPLAGLVRQQYSTYHGVWLVCGTLMTLSPLILFFIPKSARKRGGG